jgi:hypothetical protein
MLAARFRVYHPSLGRWTRRDSLGFADGLNLYEYVRSSPIRYVDAFGLQAGEVKPSNPFKFDVHDAGGRNAKNPPNNTDGTKYGTGSVTVSWENLCDEEKKGKITVKIHYQVTLSGDGELYANGKPVPMKPGKQPDPGGDNPGETDTYDGTFELELPVCPTEKQSGQIYLAAAVPLYKNDNGDRTGVLHVITIDYSYKCKKQKEKPCCVEDEPFKANITFKHDPEANLPLEPPKPDKNPDKK